MTKIQDPLLEPFYIAKDSHCYTVYENVIPEGKRGRKSQSGTAYEKVRGHYTNFGNALKCISKNKLNKDSGEYNSIREYITEWKRIQTELNQLLNFNNL
jgi:hypothetical protein